MPTIRLSAQNAAQPVSVVAPTGAAVTVPFPQLVCLLRLPGVLLPRDAVIDTGAALIWVPEDVWRPLRAGVEFDWLPFAPGAQPPTGQLARWRFTFQMARFLAPVSVMDYSTEVERPNVIAAFTTGNPPGAAGRKGLPPIVVGLWGGLLEGSRLAIRRDPTTGRVAGDLEFP